jgi:hypothetical protein
MPTTRYGDHVSTGGNLALNAETLKRDVVDKIFYKEADLAPLTLLLRKASKKTARSYKHEWLEKDDMPLFTQVNKSGGYTSGATSIIVDDSDIVALTSLIVNQRTNEVMRVTANNVSTNTLTVSRSWGGTAAAAMNDNDYVSILGTSPAEGAESNVGQQVIEDEKFNYVQEFRDSFSGTWIADNSDQWGGIKPIPRRRAERGRDHKKRIELAMFFGERNTDTSGDERISSMGGFKEFISTNSSSFGGVVTFEEIVQAAELDFEYGSDKKMLFAGAPATSNIALIAKDHIRVADVAETFGLKMRLIEAQHGQYVLMKHKLFRGDQHKKLAFVIDMANVKYVPMQNLDTRLRQGLEANSATATKEEWYTACTIERILEDSHGIWTNVA